MAVDDENHGTCAQCGKAIVQIDTDGGLWLSDLKQGGTYACGPEQMLHVPAFVWDKSYKNHEQVRPYMYDFLRVHAEIESTGAYTYNDSFKGRIPGIVGNDEDTAIYMLQNLKRLDELAVQVADFLADGGQEITELHEPKRGTVVMYGFYVGGSGWQEFHKARLVPRDGKPWAVLPKGARTNGHFVHGKILIKEGV